MECYSEGKASPKSWRGTAEPRMGDPLHADASRQALRDLLQPAQILVAALGAVDVRDGNHDDLKLQIDGARFRTLVFGGHGWLLDAGDWAPKQPIAFWLTLSHVTMIITVTTPMKKT